MRSAPGSRDPILQSIRATLNARIRCYGTRYQSEAERERRNVHRNFDALAFVRTGNRQQKHRHARQHQSQYRKNRNPLHVGQPVSVSTRWSIRRGLAFNPVVAGMSPAFRREAARVFRPTALVARSLATYLGGCKPGLFAQRSRFSITFSWLGRVGEFWSFGPRGCLISLFISILHPTKYCLHDPKILLRS